MCKERIDISNGDLCWNIYSAATQLWKLHDFAAYRLQLSKNGSDIVSRTGSQDPHSRPARTSQNVPRCYIAGRFKIG